jgi:glutamine amidotransferase
MCELLKMSSSQPTRLTFSHIRHATRGGVSLANTQPFVRELSGRTHVFAHNGDLPGIYRGDAWALGRHRPVGQTDSKHAFCALLSRLSTLWQGNGVPPLEARRSALTTFAADLRALGPVNFLYADGDALFAHGHRHLQPILGRAELPGLWCLRRECASVAADADDLAGVSVGTAARSAVLLASVPLSAEAWRPLAEGELLVARLGEFVAVAQR